MPRVTVDGDVELYYESLGEGTPLVFQAHDHTPWLFLQAPVFSQRYRVLAYDRRGTGRSASPAGEWTAADLARDLAGFLDALGIARAIVAGSSLGGVVTAQFALDHPGRALALVIGHTVPYLDDAGRAWVAAQVADARAGRPVVARQPADAGATEGPPTTIRRSRRPRSAVWCSRPARAWGARARTSRARSPCFAITTCGRAGASTRGSTSRRS